MSKPKIVCVVPTIRPESHTAFVKAWTPLFVKHEVVLVTIWDGEVPEGDIRRFGGPPHTESVSIHCKDVLNDGDFKEHRDLFCRFTDACRNLGFVTAAKLKADYVLTLDDDVVPAGYLGSSFGKTAGGSPWSATVQKFNDPIQEHLDILSLKAPVSWMNTSQQHHMVNGRREHPLYLRGMPYGVRDEASVMLSHGVWVGTPDFDGETQLRLENESRQASPAGYIRSAGQRSDTKLPHSLPYFVGPVPRGVLFPLCGMNVMVRREALPYFYFAPMGPDSSVAGLNRFADIWMGVFLKREFDRLGWACYTGGSTVFHTRASDARKNFEQEKLGREWNERIGEMAHGLEVGKPVAGEQYDYFESYADKRIRYSDLIRGFIEGDK